MRKLMLFGTLLLCGSTFAQTIIQASLTPPSVPVVDLGNDTTVTPNSPVTLTAAISSGTGPFTYSWTPASAVDDPTAQIVVATVANTTLLEVVVADSNGCEATDDVNLFVSGISAEQLNNNFGISPNPSTGIFTIELFSVMSGSVYLHGLNGALLFEGIVTGGQERLDFSHLTDGVYLLSVVTETGVSNERIIIKK
ncbi:MAG: T9SS type A sorting domain-containing protein [Schleiferiaceae bacterium]|nr:T9SS type A sorting domain-containing protein [Schleiferiaceae bacterium]